jgi:hypothetical protein
MAMQNLLRTGASSNRLRGRGFSCAAALLVGLCLSNHGQAAAPAWWSARGVATGASPDDFAVANIGQFKNMMKAAMDELDARLTGGAGTALHALIQSWITPPAPPAAQPDDFAKLTQGQMKNAVTLVYDRLVAAGQIPAMYSGLYPWTAPVADDDSFAVVNVGQLKHEFDFDLLNPDRDGDGLPDLLELVVFHTSPGLVDSNGNGIPDGLEDSDGDGIQNIDEVRFGLNATLNDGGVAGNFEGLAYDSLGRLSTATAVGGAVTHVGLDNEGNIVALSH